MKNKIYRPKVIKNIEFKELFGESKRSEKNKKFKKGRLVQNRVNLSSKDKYILSLELIQEWSKLGKKAIPIKIFPFLQIERQLIPPYLNKLKELGCFSRWTTNPFKSEANGEIIFDGVNLSIISKLIEGQVHKSDKKFWFEEKVFNFKFPDGSIRQIDFSPKRNENHTPDPFYLLQALVNFSRKDGSFVENRIEVHINREELINKIKNDYPKPEKITLDWIKNTKRNLISMIPIEYRDLINLSNFNRKEREYLFTVQL